MKRAVLLIIVALQFTSFVPVASAQEQECKLIDAKFTNGGFNNINTAGRLNWYKGPENEVKYLIQTRGCAGKEIAIHVKALSDPRYNGGNTNFDDNIYITAGRALTVTVTDPGAGVAEVNTGTFLVDEEKCLDLNADTLNLVNGISEGYLPLLLKRINDETKSGISDDQILQDFAMKSLEYAKSGNFAKDFAYYTLANYKEEIASDSSWNPFDGPGIQAIVAQNDPVAFANVIQQQINTQVAQLGNDPVSALTFINRLSTLGDKLMAKLLFAHYGIADCVYQLGVEMPDGIMTYGPTDTNKLAFFCTDNGIVGQSGDDCRDGPMDLEGLWRQGKPFAPGVAGKTDATSLCYDQTLNNGAGGYDPSCYELLAPIPGLGRKIDFDTPDSSGNTFTLGTYIGTIIRIAVGAATLFAVIFLTYAGIQYMIAGQGGGGVKLQVAKEKIMNGIIGLGVVAISWLILNTINPELLNISPVFKTINLDADVYARTDNPQFNTFAEQSLVGNATPVDVATIGGDSTFIAYYYHQQGPGGAPTVLWTAKKGLTAVPYENPFLKSRSTVDKINRDHLRQNYPAKCTQSLGAVSPGNHVSCIYNWVQNAKVNSRSINPALTQKIDQAAREVGVDPAMLRVFCFIESACGNVMARTGTYVGYFAMSTNVYDMYKPANAPADGRLDIYYSAYATAGLLKANLRKYESDKTKILN